MSQTEKTKEFGQIRRRCDNEDSERSDDQKQYQFGYNPPMGGGSSFNLSLDSSVGHHEADHHSRNIVYDDYSDDSRLRGAVGYDPRYGPLTSSAVYSDESEYLSIHKGTNENIYYKRSDFGSSNVDPAPRRKRQQRCRFCANHKIDQLLKGHKHFCLYSKCNCRICNVTKNRQHYMKEQERMIRRQKQEMTNDVPNTSNQQNQNTTIAASVQSGEYPDSRRQEMEKDLDDIDMPELIAISEYCTKKSKDKSKSRKMKH